MKLYCATYENKDTIKVTACWLEKEIGDEWEFDCSLTPPTEESHNTNGYAASFNCLSSTEAERTALQQHSMLMVMR